ncbi:hypothetical protein [Pantoea phytobeneficialis]|uniref:Uncharacterized protein n=1 Tax=Pantoea phytobeneficialis TaxID=2052056 RepID=A0AAP9KPE4_9GAMM|nr:hypothetical protein [Pantoea phytobeneficialis]MDO6405574.1 hypothetical protein [Pantoea phytobeneficialis]QGR06778.1 hypothetical protein CTZ24_10285 [Pantoea phytobeneficialis]
MLKFKFVFSLVFLLSAFSSYAAGQQSSMTCKDTALKDAKKLLSFYRDNDDRISIDNKVTPLEKVSNPQNPSQKFDVLEAWGYIYKGKYRMRFSYYSDLDCTLMGEEILEYADL